MDLGGLFSFGGLFGGGGGSSAPSGPPMPGDVSGRFTLTPEGERFYAEAAARAAVGGAGMIPPSFPPPAAPAPETPEAPPAVPPTVAAPPSGTAPVPDHPGFQNFDPYVTAGLGMFGPVLRALAKRKRPKVSDRQVLERAMRNLYRGLRSSGAGVESAVDAARRGAARMVPTEVLLRGVRGFASPVGASTVGVGIAAMFYSQTVATGMPSEAERAASTKKVFDDLARREPGPVRLDQDVFGIRLPGEGPDRDVEVPDPGPGYDVRGIIDRAVRARLGPVAPIFRQGPPASSYGPPNAPAKYPIPTNVGPGQQGPVLTGQGGPPPPNPVAPSPTAGLRKGFFGRMTSSQLRKAALFGSLIGLAAVRGRRTSATGSVTTTTPGGGIGLTPVLTPGSSTPTTSSPFPTIVSGGSWSSGSAEDPCGCKRRRGKARKCLERATVAWKTGRKKGSSAGSKCLRWAPRRASA